MRSIRPLFICLIVAALAAGCKKDQVTPPNTTTNGTLTNLYPNDSLANDAATFYVIADVEGVPGQAKLYVKSDYYGLSRVVGHQCQRHGRESLSRPGP